MQNSISSDRLILNMLTREDDEFIIHLLNSKGWLEFIGDRNIHTKDEALAYINKILGSQNIFYWVVRIKNGNIPIGIVSFLKRDYLENFDIGFAFLPDFTGQGYAYEAAKEILGMVKEHPEYNPVLATTLPGNISSIRLLAKLGLVFEKELEINYSKIYIYTNAGAMSVMGENRGDNQ